MYDKWRYYLSCALANAIMLMLLSFYTNHVVLNYLSCTVLYCTVLYCTVLYCTVLYCTVLYCTLLSCSVLSYLVLFCHRSVNPFINLFRSLVIMTVFGHGHVLYVIQSYVLHCPLFLISYYYAIFFLSLSLL